MTPKPLKAGMTREEKLAGQKRWRETHKEYMKTIRLAWSRKNPWYKSYHNAKTRCNDPKNPMYIYYGKKGIKFLMEVDDFKHLWFRDKAWLLKKPSIDRIDSKGNYELNNCRFIELSINAAAGGRQKKPRRVARLGLKCTKAHKEKISRAKKGIPWTEARRLAQENRKKL